jgi:peptide chain release factor subunit 1
MYLTIPTAPGDAHSKAVTKADSLLHEIRPLADDRTLDHSVRLSLRQDIQNIEAILDMGANTPQTLAIVSCSGAGLLEVLWLPRRVRDRIVVDKTPWIRPLLAVLSDYRRCFVVLVDRETPHAWELYLGRVRDAGPLLRGREAREAKLRAVNERRDPHKAEEHERRHFRLLAGALDDLFGSDRNTLLILGSHENELSSFLELLGHPLRERLVGTFAVDHTAVNLGTVRERAEAILDRYELDRQRRRVAELIDAAAAGGHAVVGLDACLWAGSMAAVEDLYVQEEATAPGVVCDRSRWLASTGDRCPVCGARTRQTPDVIDELTEAVIDEGGSIHHVRAETELAEELVACALRFELPSRG